MNTIRKTLSALAIATSLFAFGGTAFAAPKNVDGVASVAKKKGDKKTVSFDQTFVKWVVSPRGDVVGMLLGNGAEVRIPPRGYAIDTTKLQQGDVVHVEAREHAMTDGTIYSRPLIKKGMDVVVDATGKPNVAANPGAKPKLQKMKTSGTVAGFLLDGKDHKVAIVLQGGEIGWTHADAMQLGINKGDAITLEGMGGNWSNGTALAVHKIVKADGKVVTVPHAGKKGGNKAKK